MNPSQPRLLRVEAVADLPVLWATFQRLDLPATLGRHFPAPLHWKGPLTPGEVLAVWLLFLVSQGDHCLNHVQPWIAQHQGVRAALLGEPVLSSAGRARPLRGAPAPPGGGSRSCPPTAAMIASPIGSAAPATATPSPPWGVTCTG